MRRFAVLVEIFHQLRFMGAAGECLPQQGGGLGVIFRGERAYFHGFCARNVLFVWWAIGSFRFFLIIPACGPG